MVACFLFFKKREVNFVTQSASMRKYKWWIYLGFFGILLLLFFWAIKDEHQFTDSKLAVINANIPAFEFINQDGKVISQKNTEGKVYVAEYFFTTCKGICPKMNLNMRRVYDQFKDEQDFMIISHTCMPEVDSINLLKAYEQKMLNATVVKKDDNSYKLESEANNNATSKNTQWNFVTGKKSDLYKMARQGYMIDNGKPDSLQGVANQFIHTQFFALVDRYGRVRGIYDGLKEDELQKLISDIPELLKEKIDHTRFMNGFSNTPN
jgi:protein SCO1/2